MNPAEFWIRNPALVVGKSGWGLDKRLPRSSVSVGVFRIIWKGGTEVSTETKNREMEIERWDMVKSCQKSVANDFSYGALKNSRRSQFCVEKVDSGLMQETRAALSRSCKMQLIEELIGR